MSRPLALLAVSAAAMAALCGCGSGGSAATGTPGAPAPSSPTASGHRTQAHKPSAPPPELVTRSAKPKRPQGTPHRVGPLVLTLRHGWRVLSGPAHGDVYVATASCTHVSLSCRGFRLVGASGIAHGNRGHRFRANHPFLPKAHGVRCPGDPRLTERAPKKPKAAGYWPIGSKRSVYHQWTIRCVNAHHHVKGTFSQWTWYLPKSHVLVVDEWDTLTLGTILRWAKWA